MGHVYHQAGLYAQKARKVRMFVDTGSTFSIIPRALADSLGITYAGIKHRVQLADGRHITMKAATLGFRVLGRDVPSTVLVGKVDEPILGVETLEALGLAVDPRSGKLKKTRSWTLRVGPVIRR
ncbi:MAG: retroviral-like aspartic protease family protein [Planctomycetota bacterium]